MSDGHKQDEGKTRYDLVPPEAEELIARVFTFGANKYGDREWENGKVVVDRWYAATRRHLNAVRDGEYTDPESGLPHLAHAATGIIMWLTLVERNRGGEG